MSVDYFSIQGQDYIVVAGSSLKLYSMKYETKSIELLGTVDVPSPIGKVIYGAGSIWFTHGRAIHEVRVDGEELVRGDRFTFGFGVDDVIALGDAGLLLEGDGEYYVWDPVSGVVATTGLAGLGALYSEDRQEIVLMHSSGTIESFHLRLGR